MANSRRRRITLRHWLLIVGGAAVVSFAVVQTLSILDRNRRMAEAERARWLLQIKLDQQASETMRHWGPRPRLETFDLFRPHTKPICDSGQRLRMRFRYLIAFETSDLFPGDRCKVTPFQAPLFP
jgi:hypothetical protein